MPASGSASASGSSWTYAPDVALTSGTDSFTYRVSDGQADALCTALQVLNHLQDLVPDRDRLDRIYLPLPWLDPAGGAAVPARTTCVRLPAASYA